MTLTHRAGLRYLKRHPWLTALSILGIALGVAVVVSIDVANSSARRAFTLSAERVTGRATHSILGVESVSDSVFRDIRIGAGIRPSAPIVEGYVEVRGRTFEVLGLDPFFDQPFRGYASSESEIDLAAFLGPEPVVLLAARAAEDIGVQSGDTLAAVVSGRIHPLIAGGMLDGGEDREGDAMANLIVTDVGTAQRLFGMEGRLSRIDLVLPDDGSSSARVEAVLPDGVRLIRSGTRTETVLQMTRAFEVNLTALSLLALVVGMFLIYNTMTFSVVQRRPLIGRLRAIGVTDREVFRLVLYEAVLLGAAGTVLGLGGGIALSRGLVGMVAQTINDLYYAVDVQEVSLDPWILVKGGALGIGATLLAAIAPAREAARSPVAVVLQRSEEEVRARRNLPRSAAVAAVVGAVAVVLLLASGRSIVLSYVALFLILVAFALIVPLALTLFARGVRRLMGRLFGVIGRMAAQGVIHNLSRTSVAAAALAIAVAAAVGVGVMIGSFRATVSTWLEYTLQADLYVQAPSTMGRLGGAVLRPELADAFSQIDEVEAVSTIRQIDLTADGDPIEVAGVAGGPNRRASVRFVSGNPDDIWRGYDAGDVIVSEPLAYRKGLGRGDSLRLPTSRGMRGFHVAGVFYDYGSDLGMAMMSRTAFERHFDAPGLSGISLYVHSNADLARVASRVREAAGAQEVIVRSNRDLRAYSLEIFDRSFAITSVLRLLALLVAFVGLVSALMAIQIERRREFAVLRAEGLTPGQLWRYVTLETCVLGTAAGLAALPLGVVLAAVLVFVINKRSFGWTLEIGVDPGILAQAVVIALIASLLAGLYPAFQMARSNPADALRGE